MNARRGNRSFLKEIGSFFYMSDERAGLNKRDRFLFF